MTFHVKHEFDVSLTVMGDGPNIPWRLLDVEILVQDKDVGGKQILYQTIQVYLHTKTFIICELVTMLHDIFIFCRRPSTCSSTSG